MARSALLLFIAAATFAATRPHYGGTLRVEVREANEFPDPPQAGNTLAQLTSAFSITQWIAGSQAAYAANETAPGGRPFLDTVEVQLGRTFAEQAADLQLGKADIIQLDPAEPRRAPAAGRQIWSSSPVRIVALVFGPRADDVRIREGLSLAVDRAAIHTVLLQRQGEISGALLPQWISGYAFVFSAAQDSARARALAAAAPPAARTLSFSVPETSYRRIADRISLDARDAGITLVRTTSPAADVRLVELRISSIEPAHALASLAASLGLSEPQRADTPDELYTAERTLLDSYRVAPLFHLPDVYAVGPRVKGGPGITPLGEWRFGNLWLEGARP